MFKIIGDGAFAKAMIATITQRNGIVSNDDYTWIIPCVPSYVLPSIELEKNKKILLISKGMIDSDGNGKFVTEWCEGRRFAYMAGPHLASELEAGLPTMSTIACENKEDFDELAPYIPGPVYSRNYHAISTAGVLKNIIAYTCGAYEAGGYGENVRSCIIQLGFIELQNICNELSFEIDSIISPAIVADTILTSCSPKSRNFKAGFARINGTTSNELTECIHSVQLLIKRIGVSDMWPISSFVFRAVTTKIKLDLDKIWPKFCNLSIAKQPDPCLNEFEGD